MDKDTTIREYEHFACDILELFLEKYYNEMDPEEERDWIGGEIGGVIQINDEYWDLRTMVRALKEQTPKDKLLKQYWTAVDEYCTSLEKSRF